ncbi:hypothetical protein PV10_07314 [Exophiala mesophila]|uniref:Uncharacterized protein n=1 Tax=Exophiala mesophila TaxID=212818 RepID=A0A0D1XPE1_EXOME|nr:uncharacterized protein PV10_07314 [Exophiala mesophila]KIV89961.1 hypothetical protein PV10_07314 [Exophiala mesophila]
MIRLLPNIPLLVAYQLDLVDPCISPITTLIPTYPVLPPSLAQPPNPSLLSWSSEYFLANSFYDRYFHFCSKTIVFSNRIMASRRRSPSFGPFVPYQTLPRNATRYHSQV